MQKTQKRPVELDEAQQRLVEAHVDLVPRIINRFFGYEYSANEDYVSEGYIALCQAALHYDPDRGAQFNTYLTRSVVNRMLSVLDKESLPMTLTGWPVMSLNEKLPGDNDYADCTEYIDLLPDPSVDVPEKVINTIQGRRLRQIVRERAPMLYEQAMDGLTCAQMARRHKKSRQRMNIICRREVIKLLRVLKRQEWV